MLEVADILRRYGDEYLQKFGDKMLIVSRTRARKRLLLKGRDLEWAFFADFPRVLIGRLGYLTQVVGMYRRKQLRVHCPPCFAYTITERAYEKDTKNEKKIQPT